MTKKLIGLLPVAVFSITTLNAASFTICTLTSPPNSATSAVTNGTPSIVGVNPSYTCSFSVPSGDTVTSVSTFITNPYNNGVIDQTNELRFSYLISGFAGATALTDTVQGDFNVGPPVGDNGVDPDTGALSGPAECSQSTDVSFTCTTNSFVGAGPNYAFTVTGSASWVQGGVNIGGGESFTVYVADTYAATPEPGTLLMMGGGLIGLVLGGRRKFWNRFSRGLSN
jgi:hypothetical protein